MITRVHFTFAALVALGSGLLVWSGHVAAQPSAPAFVHITAAPITVLKNVHPARAMTAVIKIVIDKGYHLQGNNAKDPYIPTTATVDVPAGITIGKIVYPPSIRKEFSGETLPVYESKVDIKIPITVAGTVKTGKLTLPVTIKYQGCNSTACYPPSHIATTITVNVGEAK